MGFYNSTVKLRPDGLYRATIRYAYFYFYTSEVSESFKTLGEARDWILNQRCPDYEELIEEESEEIKEDNCETTEITGNAFEDDSDDDLPLVDSDSDSDTDCESTEQDRNIRLNKQVTLEELKKKTFLFNRRKPKKFNIKFQN